MLKKKPKGKSKLRNAPKPASGPANDLRLYEANAIIASFNQSAFALAEIQARLFCKKYPNVAFGWKMIGLILGKCNRQTEAISALNKATDFNPYDPDIFKSLGDVYHHFSQLEEAIEAYNKALAINPDFAEARNSLGVALHLAGRDDEAVSQYEKVLEIMPEHAECLNNMGISLAKQGQFDAAVPRYRQSIQINPGYFEACNNLGLALLELGNIDDAVVNFKKALNIKPDSSETFFSLGYAFMQYGQHEKAISYYLLALKSNPTSTNIFDTYYIVLNSIANCQQTIFEACQKFYSNLQPTIQHNYDVNQSQKKDIKKIHIGYVSGDFNKSHPLHFFIQGILQNHDKNMFEVTCYFTSEKIDTFTDKVRTQVSHWKNIVDLTDDEAMQCIQSDAVDILVDLSGHTKNNRLSIFARKPAQIQVTWLGFLNTTGLSSIDYILCNRWLVTPEDIKYCSEKPWHLDGPSTFFWNEALEYDRPISRLPALDNGFMTFGSFNNFYKITPSAIQCWIAILQRVPKSRLFCKAKIFQNKSIVASFLEKFTAASVDASRITVAGPTSLDVFLEELQNIDINLDTFPYNGGTVTCHSLSMGVPVLTVKGKSVIAHVGESFLQPLGLNEWIAEDREDYVTKAIAWSEKLAELALLRQTLRKRFKTVYGDAVAFTKRLEDAYTGMYNSKK